MKHVMYICGTKNIGQNTLFSSLQALYEILITLVECGNHTPDQTYAENCGPTKFRSFFEAEIAKMQNLKQQFPPKGFKGNVNPKIELFFKNPSDLIEKCLLLVHTVQCQWGSMGLFKVMGFHRFA